MPVLVVPQSTLAFVTPGPADELKSTTISDSGVLTNFTSSLPGAVLRVAQSEFAAGIFVKLVLSMR